MREVRRGVETGDSGEGGEVETRDDFNDLTTSTLRETDVLPSSDEDDIDENSQQLPEEDGAEKEETCFQKSTSLEPEKETNQEVVKIIYINARSLLIKIMI